MCNSEPIAGEGDHPACTSEPANAEGWGHPGNRQARPQAETVQLLHREGEAAPSRLGIAARRAGAALYRVLASPAPSAPGRTEVQAKRARSCARSAARISLARSCDDHGQSMDGSPARCEADCRPARGPVGQRVASNERGGRACGLVQKGCTIRSRLRRDIVHLPEFPALLIEQVCNACVARGRSPALRAFRYGSTRR
mgnify:CR=1 FL=1